MLPAGVGLALAQETAPEILWPFDGAAQYRAKSAANGRIVTASSMRLRQAAGRRNAERHRGRSPSGLACEAGSGACDRKNACGKGTWAGHP